jgi:hypothetical protein
MTAVIKTSVNKYYAIKPGIHWYRNPFLFQNFIPAVSGYGLDDREIEVRSQAEERDFFSILCVQTGSGAHPASCTMGNRAGA